jgi:DNA-binding IclR family transcriptional regulator
VSPVKDNIAVSRSVNILIFMAQTKKAVTLTEISRSLDIPKSSALNILYTLVKKGLVEIENPDLKTYQLGIKLFTLGAAVVNKNDLQVISQSYLTKLSEETKKTVFIAVPNEKKITYVSKIEGTSPVQYSCSLGSENPMHLTGIGKAYLATKTDDYVYEVYGSGPYERRTAKTLTTYDELINDLHKTRKRGYAIDDGEGIDNLYCLAAPLFDYENKAIAAISIVSLADEISDHERNLFIDMLIETAMSISKRLGYTRNSLY